MGSTCGSMRLRVCCKQRQRPCRSTRAPMFKGGTGCTEAQKPRKLGPRRRRGSRWEVPLDPALLQDIFRGVREGRRVDPARLPHKVQGEQAGLQLHLRARKPAPSHQACRSPACLPLSEASTRAQKSAQALRPDISLGARCSPLCSCCRLVNPPSPPPPTLSVHTSASVCPFLYMSLSPPPPPPSLSLSFCHRPANSIRRSSNCRQV
jgi:hypothetical protein